MKLQNPRGSTEGSIYTAAVPGISDSAVIIENSIREAHHHWLRTLTSQRGSIEEDFRRLAKQWKADTEFQSSVTRIAMHPAYQRIIGMGPSAVPLILRDLDTTHDPWFWALAAITGADPVPPEDRGYIDRMVRAWVRWGIRQNFI
jgi:hypothetical protein